MTMKLILLTVITLALVACGANSGDDRSNAPSPTDPATVNMSATAFVPASTTINVGDNLTLVSDGVVPHFIANGRWQNGNAAPERKTGHRQRTISRSWGVKRARSALSPRRGATSITAPYTPV